MQSALSSTPKPASRAVAAAKSPLSPLNRLSSPGQFASPNSSYILDTTRAKYENDVLDRPYLPDCWTDDKRMEVLFSPFRVRDTNPEGWDLKMNFWTNYINKWCLNQRRVVFTIDDLRKAFVRGDHHPHVDCLKLGVSHMKRAQSVLFREDIINPRTVRSLGRNVMTWTVNSLIVKPISLGWSLLSGGKDDDEHNITHEEKILSNINVDTKLYNKETLDILVESVESYLRNMKTTCMRYRNFYNLINKNVFAEKPIDEATFDIIIEVSESRGKLKTLDESGIHIVKFGKETTAINPTDITLIKLEVTKEILEHEIEKLEDEIENLRTEAKQVLANKSREKALLLLKRKKRLETKVNDKETQIDNIDSIYQQLLDSDSQQAIMAAYQLANDVLKGQSINMEEIEKTVTEVEDTLGDIATLTSEINRPIGESNAAVELEAEEELDQMLKDIEEEKAAQQRKSAAVHRALDQLKNESLLEQLSDLTIVDSDISTESVKDGGDKPTAVAATQ